MRFMYCPICGQKLIEKNIGDEGLVMVCNECDRPYFDSPSSCVEVIIINEKNQILLLKQNYISKTHWGVVSGYVNNGETLESAEKFYFSSVKSNLWLSNLLLVIGRWC